MGDGEVLVGSMPATGSDTALGFGGQGGPPPAPPVPLQRTLDLVDGLAASLAVAAGLAGTDPGFRRRLAERTLGALLDHLLLDPAGPAVVRRLHAVALGGRSQPCLAAPARARLESLLAQLLVVLGDAAEGPGARDQAGLLLGRLLTGIRGRHLRWQAGSPPPATEVRRCQQQLMAALLRQLCGERRF